MATVLRSVSAFQSLLEEDDYDLKEAGLQSLLSHVNAHWSDIANNINDIQKLYRDPKFGNKQLAAMLLSKLYFNLNDYKEALNYALKSGNYFNVDETSDFTEVLVNKTIEHYIYNKRNNVKDDDNDKYKAIVDRMVEKSIQRKQYRMPLGIAIQSLDFDLARRIVQEISYHELVEAVLPHLDYMEIDFKKNLLTEISRKPIVEGIFCRNTATTPNQYINMMILFKSNNDYETVSKLIYECVKKRELEIAYTLALEVGEMHGFNHKVAAALPIQVEFQTERKNLEYILEGEFKEEIHRTFLKKFAKTDPHYQTLLKSIEPKNSVAHCSAQLALSLLQAYTHNDEFIKIKENFEWAAKATHWAKFSAIASLGLIFRNIRQMTPMKPFLPESNKDVVNHYPNGGALYGLGLIYAGSCDQAVIDYIMGVTRHADHSKNDVVMHGSCLGLGLTAFASENNDIKERLNDFMNISSSVIGEAAGLSLGLVFAGTANEAILGELLNYAEETDHEKVLRSICMSIGILNFGKPSKEILSNLEGNPKVKLSVPMYIAMAYFKTSNHEAVRKLLNCTNDISNEVKRSAVIALGFVMYHDPHLIELMKMMIYSYNPSIRYACAMALMVGCKETKDALDLIWPLLTDAVDYVRQAAFISISIIMQVSTVQSEPRLADFRKIVSETMAKKHEETLSKMGAILANGLLDIGGRNMVVSLTTRAGVPKIQSVVYMLVFTHFWNWFPYINFIGLTLTVSAFIGVTAKLRIPTSFTFKSACKSSMFDYPPNIVKEEKKEETKKDTKVTLSTTVKFNARAKNKKSGKDDLDSEPSLSHQVSLRNQTSVGLPSVVPAAPAAQPNLGHHSLSMPPEIESNVSIIKEKKQQKQEKKQELFTILHNPTRVAEKQRKFIQFTVENSRYHPILPERKIGIIFLKDSRPNEPDEYLIELNKPVQAKEAQKPPAAQKEPELPAVPESFTMEEEDEMSLKQNKEG